MIKNLFLFIITFVPLLGHTQTSLGVTEIGSTYELDGKLYLVQTIDEQSFVTRDNGDTLFFTFLESMPEYPGGIKEMFGFLGNNMIYPNKAKNKGIEGTIIINFVVGKDGTLRDVHAVKWKNELLKNEAERVVKLMPKWKPGYQKGKAVSVSYNLPIKFTLQKGKKKK